MALILQQIDNVLFILCSCKKAYALKTNEILLQIFDIQNKNWIPRFLGKIRRKTIVYGKYRNVLLTNLGFSMSRRSKWNISLKPVKRFVTINEGSTFLPHHNTSVVVLFFDGTLEFIKLRGKRHSFEECGAFDSEFIQTEQSKAEFSYNRKIIFTQISDFAIVNRGVFIITKLRQYRFYVFDRSNVYGHHGSFYHGQIRNRWTKEYSLEFSVVSCIYDQGYLIAMKDDGEVVMINRNSGVVEDYVNDRSHKWKTDLFTLSPI